MAGITCSYCAHCFDEALIARVVTRQGAITERDELEEHRRAMRA